MVIDWLKRTNEYVIYGAQVVAVGAYVAIAYLTGRKPMCFAVGTLKGNPKEIDGIPVKLINTIQRDSYIVVCATELIQKEVVPYLNSQGYANIFVLTSYEEYLLMSQYFQSVDMFPLAR